MAASSTKAYAKVSKIEEIEDVNSYTLKVQGKELCFHTPGTKAQIVLCVSSGLHTAMFVEGPVRLDGKECQHLLIHLAPGGIRLEGDDDKNKLRSNVERLAGDGAGSPTWMAGEEVAVDVAKYPVTLFKTKCADHLFDKGTGQLLNFSFSAPTPSRATDHTPVPSVLPGLCPAALRGVVAGTAVAYPLTLPSLRHPLSQLEHYSGTYTNCKRFGNLMSLAFGVPMPRELDALAAAQRASAASARARGGGPYSR